MKFFSIKKIAAESQLVIRRFPLLSLLCLLETVLVMISIQFDNLNDSYMTNLLGANWIAIMLVTASSFAAIGHSLTKQKKILLETLSVSVGAIYYFLLPAKWIYPWSEQYAFFCLGGFLLILVAGFKFREQNRDLVESYLLLLQRAVVTAFFSMVLYGGLASAIWSFCTLLGIKIDYKVYSHLAALIFGLFSPLFFLGGVPFQFSEHKLDFPRLFKMLLQYLLLPIVGIYLLILYIYMAKISFTATWPEGMVAELILSYASIGIAVFFLLWPLGFEQENSWIRRMSNYFYLALLPLLVMLFLAIERRVSEYGLTVDRYLVIALAIWMTMVALYMVFSRNKNLKVMIYLLLAAVLITAIGPLNAFNASKKSQLSRLDELLTKNKLYQNNKIAKSEKPLSFKDNKSICSILEYLSRTDGLKMVQPYFKFKSADSVTVQSLLEQLNLRYISQWENENNHNGYLSIIRSDKNSIVDLNGYRYMAEITRYSADSVKIDSLKIKVILKKEQEISYLKIFQTNQLIAQFNLNEIAAVIVKENKNSGNSYNNYSVPAEKLTFDLDNAKLTARLYIQNMDLNFDESGKAIKEINGFNAKLLFRLK